MGGGAITPSVDHGGGEGGNSGVECRMGEGGGGVCAAKSRRGGGGNQVIYHVCHRVTESTTT